MNIPQLREQFLKKYGKLPEKTRKSVVIYMNNEPYSWQVVKLEVTGKTKLGRKMLGNLHERKKI